MRTNTEKDMKQELNDAADEMVTAGLTIAKLRAANKKLRAELERVRDKCHENWENAERMSQSRHEQFLLSETWRQAHRQLCEGLGAKK